MYLYNNINCSIVGSRKKLFADGAIGVLPKKSMSNILCNVFFSILAYYILSTDLPLLHWFYYSWHIKQPFYITPTGRMEKTIGDRCNKCGRTSPRKKNWSRQWVQCDSCDEWYHLWVNSKNVVFVLTWVVACWLLALSEIVFLIFVNRECENLTTIPCQEKWYCRECLCTV